MQTTTIDLQECIATCRQCHDVCLQTLSHCIEQGNRHLQPAHMRLLLDCIDICQTNVAFMLRGSDLHQSTCATCADVCEWCAGDCERLADDEQMRTCAEVCHECARICRAMATEGETAANQPAYGEIAALAQRLREHDGARPGRDEDYWFRAEHILRERYHAKRVGRPAPMPLNQIMTEKVECAHPNATLQEAAERMRLLDIGSLPVCEGDRIAGVITDRDITVRAIALGRDPRDTRVRDIMSTDPAFCFEDQSTHDAEDLMQERQIRRLPILSRDDRLVGIVSIADLATKAGAAEQPNVAVTLESISLPPVGAAVG
jgi:CBS domain-containing protein